MRLGNGHEFTFAYVQPHKLRTDGLYQRPINQSKVNRIIEAFNPDLFKEPNVSLRDDGFYYIFDGQHGVNVHKQKFGANTPIFCKVYKGLTWNDEKELFVNQNGISSDPTNSQKLWAEYNAHNPDVTGMVNAANFCGVHVDFRVAGAGRSRNGMYASCVAVSALFSAYKLLNNDAWFEDMLSTIMTAWNGQQESLYAGFVTGMAQLWHDCHGQFRREDLVKSLSKFSPEWYIREAKDMTGRIHLRYEKLFIRVYNRKRTTRKITSVEAVG